MSLYYEGETRVRLELVQPKFDYSCRFNVVANALNFFAKSRIYTPELVLYLINQDRSEAGQSSFVLEIDTLTDEELASFIKRHCKGMAVKEMMGLKGLDFALWNDLLEAGFIIAPNHQLFYWEPPEANNTSISYFPPELIEIISTINKFSYPIFRQLFQSYFNIEGEINTGHYDIVLDVRDVNRVPSVILANLSPYDDNCHPISLPWGFFLHTTFDGDPIKDMAFFPVEEQMRELLASGRINLGPATYFFGSFEIFFPIDKKSELDQIISKYT